MLSTDQQTDVASVARIGLFQGPPASFVYGEPVGRPLKHHHH